MLYFLCLLLFVKNEQKNHNLTDFTPTAQCSTRRDIARKDVKLFLERKMGAEARVDYSVSHGASNSDALQCVIFSSDSFLFRLHTKKAWGNIFS